MDSGLKPAQLSLATPSGRLYNIFISECNTELIIITRSRSYGAGNFDGLKIYKPQHTHDLHAHHVSTIYDMWQLHTVVWYSRKNFAGGEFDHLTAQGWCRGLKVVLPCSSEYTSYSLFQTVMLQDVSLATMQGRHWGHT